MEIQNAPPPQLHELGFQGTPNCRIGSSHFGVILASECGLKKIPKLVSPAGGRGMVRGMGSHLSVWHFVAISKDENLQIRPPGPLGPQSCDLGGCPCRCCLRFCFLEHCGIPLRKDHLSALLVRPKCVGRHNADAQNDTPVTTKEMEEVGEGPL